MAKSIRMLEIENRQKLRTQVREMVFTDKSHSLADVFEIINDLAVDTACTELYDNLSDVHGEEL